MYHRKDYPRKKKLSLYLFPSKVWGLTARETPSVVFWLCVMGVSLHTFAENVTHTDIHISLS
jgi:hypothetical protein